MTILMTIILNPWLPSHHKVTSIVNALPSSVKPSDAPLLAHFFIAKAAQHNATIHVGDGFLYLVNQDGGNIMFSAWTKHGDQPASMTIGYCESGTFFEHVGEIKPAKGFTKAASEEIPKLFEKAASKGGEEVLLPKQYVLPIDEYVEELRHKIEVSTQSKETRTNLAALAERSRGRTQRDGNVFDANAIRRDTALSWEKLNNASLKPAGAFTSSGSMVYPTSDSSKQVSTNAFGTQMLPNSPFMPTYTTGSAIGNHVWNQSGSGSLTISPSKNESSANQITFQQFLALMPPDSSINLDASDSNFDVAENGEVKFKKEGWYVRFTDNEIRLVKRNGLGLIENLQGPAFLSWNVEGSFLREESFWISGNRYISKESWKSEVEKEKEHRAKFLSKMFEDFIKLRNQKCQYLYTKVALSGNPLTESEALVIENEIRDNSDFLAKMAYIDQAILAGLPVREELLDNNLFNSWATTNFDFFLKCQERIEVVDSAVTYFDPKIFDYGSAPYRGRFEPTSLLEEHPVFGPKRYQEDKQKAENQKVKEEEKNKKMDLQIDFKADLRESLKRGSVRRVRTALVEIVANLLVSDLATNKKKNAKNTVLEILKTPHGEAIFSVMLGTATPVLAAQFPAEYAKYIFEVAREFRVSGGGDLVYEVSGMLQAIAGNAFSEVKDALSQLKEFDETQVVKHRVELGGEESSSTKQKSEEHLHEPAQHRDAGTAKTSK